MRTPAAIRKPAKVSTMNFVAPTGGWIANRALANGTGGAPGASVLDNFFPTSTGIILRRGSQLRYSVGSDAVRSMFRYVSGSQDQLFVAARGMAIDEVSGSSFNNVYNTATITDNDWHVQQFSTAGGTFLIGVNGQSKGFLYDGVSFVDLPGLTESGAPFDTARLAFVFSHGNRLWFIEKDSMSAWYLPVDSIAGELTEFPMVGVFKFGGALLFGSTWSLSSGGAGGLSTQCVFVSTEGEVVAFQGLNPDSASDWSQVGLYRIGEPMGRKAFVRAGGDLLIATSVGFISLAQAASRDLAALGATAISYPIEEVWTDTVNRRGMVDWRCLVWPEGKMILISPPPAAWGETPWVFAVNSNTGAWCRFTNWDVASMEVFQGRLHFGDRKGQLWLGNVGGRDNETPYTGSVIPLYNDLGEPAARKIARNGRIVKRSVYPASEKLSAMFDFSSVTPVAPNPYETEASGVWGSGIWGESIWGEESSEIITGRWGSLGGSGSDVSVCVQVSSNDIAPNDTEIIRVDATFEICGIVS